MFMNSLSDNIDVLMFNSLSMFIYYDFNLNIYSLIFPIQFPFGEDTLHPCELNHRVGMLSKGSFGFGHLLMVILNIHHHTILYSIPQLIYRQYPPIRFSISTMVVFTFGFLWVVSQWIRVRVSKTPLVSTNHSQNQSDTPTSNHLQVLCI